MASRKKSSRRATPRVRIRTAEPSDAAAFSQVFAGREAARGTLQLPLRSVEETRKYLANLPAHDIQLVACIGARIVGAIGLHRGGMRARRVHVANIGMAVHDDWVGRGIGTALLRAVIDLADNWLGLRRLELTVYPDNDRAIALYQRFGFVIEGRHRDYALRDGAYVDALAMARLRDIAPEAPKQKPRR